MSAAVAAILDGMPDARDLHRLDSGGQTSVFAGSVQLFRYAEDDTAMRNMAVAVLRQLGFGGAEVAAVMGLTPNYVATLHQRSLREGTAGLVRQAGRPRETGETSWEQARAWRAAGVRDSEIARRLGVNQSTVLRRLGRAHVQEPLPPAPQPEPADAEPEPAGFQGRGAGRASRDGARGAGHRAAGRWPAAGGCLVPVCRGDAAARVPGPCGRRPGAGRGRRGAGGRGAADRGEHVLRAGGGDDRAVQAPGRRRGRAAGRPSRRCPGCGRCARNWQRSRTGPTR